MLCFSVNVRKLKLTAIITLSAVFIAGLVSAISSSEKSYRIQLENNTSRVGFLNINGYDVCEDNYECRTVNIPSEFNHIYNEYNKLQIQQGFDLSDYKGKEADIYTYYMNNDENINAVLIIHENNLIGCDIHNNEYGSEFLPLINN